MSHHYDKNRTKPINRNLIIALCVYLVGAIIISAWLAWTPDGFENKLKAIGYAVCHQIPSHSFFYNGNAFPLCARCTGMYLGAFTGLMVQLALGKKAGGFSKKVLIILGAGALIFAIDGINSFVELMFGDRVFYQPQNWLRLTTGMFAGFLIAAIVFPVFNQTLWCRWNPNSALDHPLAIPMLMVGGSLLCAPIIFNINPVMVLLAVISILSLLIILTMIYTTLLVVVLKQENRFNRLAEIFPILVGGLLVTFSQIGVFDLLRHALTNTWNGLPF
jgi:uncharacterized membrane protein